MTSQVRIGTSGYSFADWVGTVYPRGTKPGAFLSHYAKLFDSVEINATYYRTPSPQTFARMVERTPDNFTFVVKVPRAMTHDLVAFDRELEPFQQAIEPLVRAGRLGGLLAQFPYAFVPNEASRRHLAKLARSFETEIPVHVEFRHDAWTNEATFDLLRTLGLGFVNVDLPELPHLPRPSEVATNRTGYVRLHGRNDKTWWNQEKGGDRYDYLYSASELEPWAARIERLAEGRTLPTSSPTTATSGRASSTHCNWASASDAARPTTRPPSSRARSTRRSTTCNRPSHHAKRAKGA